MAVAARYGEPEAEAVVVECLGIADDIVKECMTLDRLVSDEEARIVGEILQESVECLRKS
jgi:hypothetical protein